MIEKKDTIPSSEKITRRDFVKVGGAAVLTAGGVVSTSIASARASRVRTKPNVLLIITDQQHIDTIAAGGCSHVYTPALDRLLKSGTSFTNSYSPNPVCSPARSAIFTSRTSSETGVYVNGRPIHSGIPNLGQWFRQETNYDTVYAGKWHLPQSYTTMIPGFTVINPGIGGFGNMCDTAVSRACEGYLRNRSQSKPFLMVASFMQPHDICEWLRLNTENPQRLRYPELKDVLPELPKNVAYEQNEPETIKKRRLKNDSAIGDWEKEQWRYYRWSYYRHIEMVDAEIGRVLQALEETGQANNTLVIFTSDHGEGMGHHQMVRKNSLYEEAVAVSLIFSLPRQIQPERINRKYLVSGLDILPTICDYTGIRTPKNIRGRSLRRILEGRSGRTHEFVISEVSSNSGRMVRTDQYKYVVYKDDSPEQLFDMKDDPGETRNLAPEAQFTSTLKDHREILQKWEQKLEVPKGVPEKGAWWYKS